MKLPRQLVLAACLACIASMHPCAAANTDETKALLAPVTTLASATKKQHERDRSMQQHVEFAAPQFVQINAGNAYFVQLATLTWVSTETKTTRGWRISSHTWAPLSETVKAAATPGGNPPT